MDIIRAHFDGQKFVPDEPVTAFSPGDRVEVAHVPVPPHTAKSVDDGDWLETVRALIQLHPVATHFVDDSRESIYAGRGE